MLVRGYPLDEMMGRVGFGDAIYLLLVGELPTPSVSRMISAILVSSVDHGAMPPSTQVSRNVATTGAPLRAAVAAGVLSFGTYHGGDVEACMDLLEAGLALVRDGKATIQDAAREMVQPGEDLDAGERARPGALRLHPRSGVETAADGLTSSTSKANTSRPGASRGRPGRSPGR